MATHILPLGIKNRMKTELPAFIALEAIGQTWFCESHRFDLMSIALVSQLMTAQGNEIHTAASTLVSLLEVRSLDVEEIRPLVMVISEWLQRQPNCRVQAAIIKLSARIKSESPSNFPTKKYA
jgi:hypothetical protein